MKLLTIGTIKPIDGFLDRLNLELEILKDEGIEIKSKSSSNDYVRFYIFYIDDEDILKGDYEYFKRMFFHCIANALSDMIINILEPKLIRKVIKDYYFYFEDYDQEMVYDMALNILDCNDKDYQQGFFNQIKRKTFILHKILEYLESNNIMIIDGFISFRLKDYLSQLEEVVDKAVDEFLIDKEYQEFIKLLKFFVDLQEPKRDIVNLIIKDDKIFLYDDEMNIIENDKNIDLFAQDNPDVSLDDIIVSTLINIAPKRIIIHCFTGNEKREVVNTLFNIFESKVVFCNQCKICKNIKPLSTK